MPTAHTPCVLIADDNPNNLMVLSVMLKGKGYEVRVAMDGVQALSSIRQLPPDLIMLDIHMPEMDGYRVCEELKKDPELKSIPVIFISALSEPFNKVQGFEKGAVDYIEKPFHLEEVEARVETQLKLRYYQERLREKAASSEERFRLTFENAAVGIAHIRMDGSFFRVNRCFCGILGYAEGEFETLTLRDLIRRDEWDQYLSVVEDLFWGKIPPIRVEKKFIRKDGAAIWLRVTISVAKDVGDGSSYGIMVVEEITDRVEAEENRKVMEGRLRQAQRMEAIGTLAGGIAHDFNNVLGAIMGHVDIARRKVPEESSVGENLAAVMTASNRARDLVQQILTSCRQVEQSKKPVKVDFVVNEALGLLRASFPAKIDINTDINRCGPILGDPTQIHQVVMNLCTNALHALEETGGILSVGLSPVTVEEEETAGEQHPEPGNYNLFMVHDTGPGIKPHLLERIFEPYFTTKPKSKGTGLGLSVVHGIVKAHDGEIIAESEESRGTLFKVYLPCMDS